MVMRMSKRKLGKGTTSITTTKTTANGTANSLNELAFFGIGKVLPMSANDRSYRLVQSNIYGRSLTKLSAVLALLLV